MLPFLGKRVVGVNLADMIKLVADKVRRHPPPAHSAKPPLESVVRDSRMGR